ncbi:MAG: extracellular solute-binding protein [Treponema sp.]|nr:extracellular solute-binding protein [Treponema sp.]
MKAAKKVLCAALILTVVAGAVFAGGEAEGSAAGGDAVIRFMTWEGETMNQAMLATFTNAIPGVKVELEPTPLQDYGVKLQEMLAANIAPDVFMVGNDMALNYWAEGLTADLTPYLQNDQEFLKGFYPGTLTTYTVGGKYVATPGLINLYGFFYNKKYFDDAGIPYPTKDWTYADMFAVAEKLKDPANNRYGIYAKTNDVFFSAIYSASKDGTSFCDVIYPVKKVQASPAFLEGITLTTQAIKSKAITDPLYDATNVNGMFMQGAIPVLFYGQWAADELIRNAPATLKWGYVPNPRVNRTAQILDAVGWAVNKKTKNLDAAFKVLKYIHTNTYGEVLSKTPVAPPAYQPAAQGYYNTLRNAGHQDMAEALDYILNAEIKLPIRFLDTWGARANRFLEADWNYFLTGERPVSDIQKAIVDPINGVIR